MERKKTVIINGLYYGFILLLIYAALKYALPVVMPFALATLIVLFLKRPAQKLAQRFKCKEKTVRSILLVAVYVLIAALCMLFGAKILSQTGKFISGLPGLYTSTLLPAMNEFSQWVEQLASEFDPKAVATVNQAFNDMTSGLAQRITEFSSMAIGIVSSFLAAMPTLIVNTVLTVVSSFYLAADYENIRDTILRYLPKTWGQTLVQARSKFHQSVGVYLRSYTIIFFMTWGELLLGLSILRVPHTLLISVLIAICDIMPILGTGTVLIPWFIIVAILGNYPLSVGLVVLYLVITIIRNTVEPKLVGHQIGLHPLLTLMSMIVGAHLFGILGLFGFPVTLSVLLPLYDMRKQDNLQA